MRLFAFFALLVLLGAAAAAITLPGSSGTAYSAFRTLRGPGTPGGGWVYHDDGKERFEWVRGSMLRIYIRRPDLGQTFIIDALARTGQAVPLDDPRASFGIHSAMDVPAEAKGQDVIDGETVTIYAAIDRYNRPLSYALTDDGIPLRVERMAGVETYGTWLYNVKRGPQPAHLFEVPDDIEITVSPQK